MKKDFITPVLVLTLICLIIAGALALVNNVTYPIIRDAAAERAYTARKDIIPEANEFILIESEELPRAVAEAYITDNHTGYIFVINVYGYGGYIKIICGIDTDGRIIKSKVVAHTETQGMGTIVFDRAVEYEGMDKNLEGSIDGIAGSTITFNAYRRAVLYAFEAFEIVRRDNLE